MRPSALLRTLVAGAVALMLGGSAVAADLTISAAASLADALRELAPRFEARQSGTHVQFNFGASGALLQQIVRGAPVDVFASADEATMDQAETSGLVRADARHVLATNTLVLVVPATARNVPGSLVDLTQPRFRRIAIGLPASVPAGRYARGALEAAGLWTAVEPRTITAQNVRQALDYVAREEVDAGFVYASDAALMPGKVKVAFTVATVTPIRYPVAVLAASAEPVAARAFVQFLLAAEARAVFARHGFGVP